MIDSVSDTDAAADLKKARRQTAAHVVTPTGDRLPPNDGLAEESIIGCVLLAPAECMPECLKRFEDVEVFYDLRRQTIWHVLVFLHKQGTPIDNVTVRSELQSRGMLEQCGDVHYLNACIDRVPSAANLPTYLEIVWEKYLARELIKNNLTLAREVFETGQLTESKIANIEENHTEWQRLLHRGAVTPKNLCAPNQFGDAYYDQWFNRKEDSFGFELPFEFPLRLRPAATTLMTGDNGSGKSSMLCLISIVVAKQLQPGEKVVVASMEMPPEVTLWIMARQLMGLGKLECTEENIARIAKALGWLNKRILLYNFLGITDKRDLMSTFEYAAEHQAGKFFIIDNMMKVGIADDDYAAQGFFIQQVCDFDLKRKVHTVVVVHENKGDGNTKQKVRGSKQLTDAPDNVVKMERNAQKAEKLAELKAELKACPNDKERIEGERRKLVTTWDSKFLLHKQRWPGAQQNGSAWLYFHHDSLQFHKEPNQRPFDYSLQ